MLLLKIINKSFFFHDRTISIYTKYLSQSCNILEFVQSNLSSFYVR